MNPIYSPDQGTAYKILCVCAKGLIRSPTLANLMSERGWNPRACGVDQDALVPATKRLLDWADYVICVDHYCYSKLMDEFQFRDIVQLDIPKGDTFNSSKLRQTLLKQLIENAPHLIQANIDLA